VLCDVPHPCHISALDANHLLRPPSITLAQYSPPTINSCHALQTFHTTTLNVLRQPADTLAVTLSHDNTAHEDLDWSDTLERHLALSGRLVEAEFVPELVFRDGVRVCMKESCVSETCLFICLPSG